MEWYFVKGVLKYILIEFSVGKIVLSTSGDEIWIIFGLSSQADQADKVSA